MKVVYSPRALADLVVIETYLADRNPHAIPRVLGVIKKAIDDLADFPRLGLSIDEENRYRLPIGNSRYVVFYRLSDDEVLILHIRHGSRRPIPPSEL